MTNTNWTEKYFVDILLDGGCIPGKAHEYLRTENEEFQGLTPVEFAELSSENFEIVLDKVSNRMYGEVL